MNARRFRAVALALVAFAAGGCASGTPTNSDPKPVVDTTAATSSAARTVNATALTLPAVVVPANVDAGSLALRWVASTGELLAMGPIGRTEFIRQHVASASAETMAANLNSDLAKLADGLPVPATELRLVETPLTIDVSLDPSTGQAHARVWSVVVFGAKDLGPPRVLFRTCQLVLVIEDAGWKLAGFTAVAGPTPVGTDSLPADWDSFSVVVGWRPVVAGEG